MRSKPTITIGIAAFNESRNITTLIQFILKQKIRNAKLTKIIIVSDGSTDDTVTKIRSLNNPRNLIEKAINITCEAYNEFREKVRDGNNVFSADGRILAFRKELVERELNIPKYLFLSTHIKYFLKNPALSFFIFLLNKFCGVKALINERNLKGTWDIAYTTKSFD